MSTRRAAPKFVASGFAISIAAAMAFASAVEAQAQVDLNLQSTINTFSPPLVVQPMLGAETPSGKILTLDENGRCGPPSTQETVEIAVKIRARALGRKSLTAEDTKDLKAEFLANPDKAMDELRDYYYNYTKGLKLVVPIKFCTGTQPTTVTINLIGNPTYETNALKSNRDSPDTSLGLGGTVLVTTAGARDFDLIVFSAGSASARYSAFPSKSLDTLAVQGFYQFFIDANGCNRLGQCREITKDFEPEYVQSPNMVTVDTLAIGFQNQTAFIPTYRREKADLLTPQVTFNRQNINLSGDTYCTPILQTDPKITKSGFCYFANLAVTVGQTFSDIATLQNANLAASATLGKRFDRTDLVLSLTATATPKVFEDVRGGRRDLLLQIGPTLAYAPSQYVTASLAVTYNQNYSSVFAAAWHGIIVQPTLTVIFPVLP